MQTTITPAEVIQEEDHTVTKMGVIKIGRSNYQIEQVNFPATEDKAAQQWLQLVGPRGTAYVLQENWQQTGIYTPISLFSGAMVRKGNAVKVIILGDVMQVKI